MIKGWWSVLLRTTKYYTVLLQNTQYHTLLFRTTKYHTALRARAGDRARDLPLPRLTPYPRGQFSRPTIYSSDFHHKYNARSCRANEKHRVTTTLKTSVHKRSNAQDTAQSNSESSKFAFRHSFAQPTHRIQRDGSSSKIKMRVSLQRAACHPKYQNARFATAACAKMYATCT